MDTLPLRPVGPRRLALPPAAASRPTRTAVVATAVALLLAGCGLRLETPEPDPLVPDTLEVVRADTAADAASLSTQAAQAAVGAPTEIASALIRVAEVSEAHLAGLGGIYVPFPDAPTPTASAEPTAEPTPPATADDVLASLVEATARARAAADTVTDGPMARLLASIAVSRSLLAEALATAAGTVAGPVVAFQVPESLPEGVTAQQAGVLVQSEDAAGLAWEVAAARSADDDRELAAARAAVHRSRAQAWAEAASLVGSGADPRRSSYALPTTLDDPDAPPEALRVALGAVEAELAETYMSLTAHTGAGSRGALIDAVGDAMRVSGAATVAAFPGLPERAG